MSNCAIYESGCPDPDAWLDQAHNVLGDPATARVLVLGDSLTTAGGPLLVTELADRGLTACVDYHSGRPTKPAVDRLLSYSRLYQPDPFDLVAMLHGTNDIYDPSVVDDQIERVKAAGLASPVAWGSVYACHTQLSPATQRADLRNTGLVNAAIYSSGLPVIDWFGNLANKPGFRIKSYIKPDGVHQTIPVGVENWAEFVANRIQQIVTAGSGS